MDSFAKVYEDICLLNMKYEHLNEVCSSLLQPWPNFDSFGKSLNKTSQSKENECIEFQLIEGVPELTTELNGAAREDSVPDIYSNCSSSHKEESKELADLKLLDSILTKAHNIRAMQSIKTSSAQAEKNSTRSMKMAAKVYQGTKDFSSKSNTVDRSSKSTSKIKLLPHKALKQMSSMATGKVVAKQYPHSRKSHLSKANTFSQLQLNQKSFTQKPKNLSSSEASRIFVSNSEPMATNLGPKTAKSESFQRSRDKAETNIEESVGPGNPTDCFRMQTNGHQLSMPSKYFKLQKLLSRVNCQCGDVMPANHGLEEARHFSRRLLQQGPVSDGPRIDMLLALGEYSYLKEELLAITTEEWSMPHKKQWQCVLRVKSRVDSILDSVSALQTLLKGQDINIHSCNSHSTVQHDTSQSQPSAGLISQGKLSTCKESPLQKCPAKELTDKTTYHTSSYISEAPIEVCSLNEHNSLTAELKTFAYRDLEEWRSLTFRELQLVLMAWESDLLEYIDTSILPLIICNCSSENSSCSLSLISSLLQTVRRLVNSNDTLTYLLIE